MTRILDLNFKIPEKDFPGPPSVNISVKTYSKSHPKGPILIPPECVTLAEVEYYIDSLQKELESIRKKAKRKFSKYGKKK